MNNKKQVIEKIRKILSMAERKEGNENEAAAAASQAKKLLDMYNLSITEISTEEITATAFQPVLAAKVPTWISQLVVTAARTLGCEMYIKLTLNEKGRRVGVMMLVGSEVDTQVCNYVCTYLINTVKRLSIEYSKSLPKEHRRLAANSYRIGAVSSLEIKLAEYSERIKRDGQNDINPVTGMNGRELILIKKDMVEKYMDAMRSGGNLRTTKASKITISRRSFDAGVAEGSRINIRTGITSQDNQKLLA